MCYPFFSRLRGRLGILSILAASLVAPSAFAVDSAPESSGPNDTTLILKQGRINRVFEMALDEVCLIDKSTGKRTFPVVENIASGAAMRAYVTELNNRPDVDARIVIYRKLFERSPSYRNIITSQVLVQLDEDHRTMDDARQVAEELGLALIRNKVSLSGWIILEAGGSVEAMQEAPRVGAHPFVLEAKPAIGKLRVARVCNDTSGLLDINDPRFVFPDMWYYHPLSLISVNVFPVWRNIPQFDFLTGQEISLSQGYTGDGVRIGVADDALDHTHEDLDPNYIAAFSDDWVDDNSDPIPAGAFEDHGTRVGGMSSARGGNGLGVIGSAPLSDLAGLRFLEVSDNPAVVAEVFDHDSGSIDILNNSWGSDEAYFIEEDIVMDELRQNVEFRERAFTFASGNDGDIGWVTGYEMLTDSRFTAAIGAINSLGIVATYSRPGAGLLTCGLAGNSEINSRPMVMVVPGNGYDDSQGPSDGTSFSCPMVSGIIALMLEARPDLGWRDVQEILARASGFPFAIEEAGFHTFRAGYGLVDAWTAVMLAENWSLLPRQDEYKLARKVVVANDVLTNQRIPAGGEWSIYPLEFDVGTTQNIRVEHALVRVEWEDGSVDVPVDIDLTSPTFMYDDAPPDEGIISDLSFAPLTPNSPVFPAPEDWTYTSVAHWGENSSGGEMNGQWRVRVRIRHFSNNLPDERKLKRIEVQLWGTDDTTAPEIITQQIRGSADPLAIDPPVSVADEEDLIVSGITLMDEDLEPNTITYQWQSLSDENQPWMDVPGQGGVITDICDYDPVSAYIFAPVLPRINVPTQFTSESFDPCGTITSWDWDFGDGNTSTEENPIHTYASSGFRTATLTVTDNDGNTNTFGLRFLVLSATADQPDPLPTIPPPVPNPENRYDGEIILPGSATIPGFRYRLVMIPSDALRSGERVITDAVYVEATPPTTACHGEPYAFEAQLPISRIPPPEVPPFVLINEFSQGSLAHPANGEWVELLTTVEVDLRDYKLDNSIVTFDAEFAQVDQWKQIPAGTLIVLYNSEFRDAVLPPDDFDPSDGVMIVGSDSALIDLPSNGDGWGEYSNSDPSYVAILDTFCNTVFGVSFNEDDTLDVQLLEDIPGQTAVHISAPTLPDFADPLNWIRTDAFINLADPDGGVTPGMANNAENQMAIDSIQTLNTTVDPPEPWSSIPRYSYTPAVPGLTIDEETGVLSGVPNLPEGGMFDIEITRSLSWDMASQTFTLTVKPAPDDSDSDRDGVVALAERALAMDLTVPDAQLLPTVSLIPNGGNQHIGMTYRRVRGGFVDPATGAYVINPALGEIHYTLWTSDDLVTWTNATGTPGALVEVSTTVDPLNPLVEIVTVRLADDITVTGLQKYLQLRFTRIPPP